MLSKFLSCKFRICCKLDCDMPYCITSVSPCDQDSRSKGCFRLKYDRSTMHLEFDPTGV